MRGGTLFSGIGAPELSAPFIDWRWCAEIDPFASAVHAARFPGVPNHGDVTKVDWNAVEPIDLLVAGSPCQSFSVAGKRLGLDDPRGNLALFTLRVARELRVRWLVFENVPGLLSSDGGRDFGALLGVLGECGYGWAYRVLDAQFAGVPQRRRRVFVVGHLGDWRRAAAVLFEPASLRGDSPPRRQARESVARPIASGSSRGSGYRNDADTADNLIASGGNNTGGSIDVATAVNAHGGPHGRLDFKSETFIAHTLRAEGFDASEDGTGRGTPLVPISFGWQNSSKQGASASASVTPTLDKSKTPAIGTARAVRRLMPVECERLQGMPDGWTAITYRGKPAADGPRYRAIGNSMAVPEIGWVLRRVALADALLARQEAA